MYREIVPYEESLALREIGFVQSCWHAYHDLTWPSNEDKHKLETFHNLTTYMEPYAHQYINPVLAPTFSQAFRWFRDNYYLNAQIAFCEYSISSENSWKYTLDNPTGVQIWNGKFNTYEEAELACLIKLITMEKETFESYLQRLKDRRTEDSYKYTDEDFEKYKEYVKHCYKTNLSVYKCLEFFYDEINNK